ncbi:hypothetical protein F5B22DRAFT_145188 [Xylaria bambusicola]|uniref:uncharacterized protein n=1 Tax=Xylaria bambusicola TaxID=326684 RepID=UPI002008389C|nr:uncharacterized protein F5B22DRAFT_145188 [Xylaria bambusicola]KAI0517059.1 hypothetical protein F5B22DRAFT_145188 [Xylaria bambusicola]
MANQEETPVPLPSAPIIQLAGSATLQPPLTRRGYGPGLVVITPGDPPSPSKGAPKDGQEGSNESGDSKAKTLDPMPQKKWAEEGYAVVQLTPEGGKQEDEGWDVTAAFNQAIEALEKLETCNVKERFGLIVYGEPAEYSTGFASKLKAAYEAESRLVASVSFSTPWDLSSRPELVHLAGPAPTSSTPRANTRQHYHASAQSASFVLPSSPDFHYGSASVSHTRSLSFLRAHLGGPIFDLEAIWDEHTAFEFAARSVAQTMGTMVDEPYVNHVPTLTGGMGREALTKFYRERFIFSNPADAGLELVSRTVGVDRVVDEFICVLTHDQVVDWLLPGIPPTHKHLRIPFTSVVNIRGDRLYHEHIHWDQGTALAQAGLLPSYLPFPYALPDGRTAGPGKRFEYRVPVAGNETAAKLADAGAHPSNGMFEYEVREVDM